MTIDQQDLEWRMSVVEKLWALGTKLDVMNERLEEIVTRQKDLEHRVSSMERAKIYGKGWLAGAVAIASIVTACAAEILRRFFGA